VPPELSRSRYITRAERGQRHPGHHDAAAETIANLDQALAEGRHEPLGLAIPFLSVDTTDGYDPDLPAILRFVTGAQPPDRPS
jgi:hypothetical protein